MLTHRRAIPADAPMLAAMNHQLIRDEGHRNAMTLPELEQRMREWLDGDYEAVLFEEGGETVAYALYRPEAGAIYLRQFFVSRNRRRQGIGRAAMQILVPEMFSKAKRITLDVLVHNGVAHEFWKAIGFQDYAVTLERFQATNVEPKTS